MFLLRGVVGASVFTLDCRFSSFVCSPFLAVFYRSFLSLSFALFCFPSCFFICFLPIGKIWLFLRRRSVGLLICGCLQRFPFLPPSLPILCFFGFCFRCRTFLFSWDRVVFYFPEVCCLGWLVPLLTFFFFEVFGSGYGARRVALYSLLFCLACSFLFCRYGKYHLFPFSLISTHPSPAHPPLTTLTL